MKFNICSCEVKIEFSFLLMISFALAFGADDIINLLLFSSLHEIGHLILLLLCKKKANKLTFSFYGLALKYDDNLTKFQETLVLLFGPIVNLVFYVILKDDINLILFLLNMLPIYPLDGGRIFNLYFSKATKIISFILLFFVYVLAIYLLVYYKSFSLILIAVYLTIYSVYY